MQAKYIYVRENRRGNQEWTIQRNWQHWEHKTHDEYKYKEIKHKGVNELVAN
jgi:hypothetical protein